LSNVMHRTMNNKRKTPAATGASELLGSEFNLKARQLFGACLIRPALAHCIPGIIRNRFSPLGFHAMNLMQTGAGIDAITKSMIASGMEDAGAIVAGAIKSVRGNPTKIFWRVIQRLCDEVLP